MTAFANTLPQSTLPCLNGILSGMVLDNMITTEQLLTRTMHVLSDCSPEWSQEGDTPSCNTPHLYTLQHATKGVLRYLGKFYPGTFVQEHSDTSDRSTLHYTWSLTPLKYAFVYVEGPKFGDICYLDEAQLQELTLFEHTSDYDSELSVMYQLGAYALMNNFKISPNLSWEVIKANNVGAANIFQPSVKFSETTPLVLPFQAYHFTRTTPFDAFSEALTVYVATATIKISRADLASFQAALRSLSGTSQYGFALDDSHLIKLSKEPVQDVPTYALQPHGPRRHPSGAVLESFLVQWQAAVDQLDWDALKNKDIDGWLMDDVLGEVLANMQWYQIMLVSPEGRFAWIS